MTPLKNKGGFTLLELILAMAIVGMIVAAAMGGLRLGIAAQEAGESRLDARQRLRVIASQLAQKIKSTYPVMIVPEENPESAALAGVKKPAGVLAFEGGKDFIRFITFAGTLTGTGHRPWPHEVRFYIGKHPQTGQHGLLMMERDLENENPFSRPSPHSPKASHHLLAEGVSYLEFRYYRVDNKAIAEQKTGPDDLSEPVIGEWVDSIVFHAPGVAKPVATPQPGRAAPEDKPITLPRGIEVYVGLSESPGKDEKEPKILRSFPLILSLKTGMKFAVPLPPEVEESDANAPTR